MSQVTKDTTIGDLLTFEKAEQIVPILLGIGMHCLGCPASQSESIAEAAEVHGVDVDMLVANINEVLA